MSDVPPEFETSDILGSTVSYIASVGSTPTLIPPSAGNPIEELSIRCAVDQPSSRRLEFSLDGTNYARLKVGETREEEPRGSVIKQIYIRSASPGGASVNYEIFLNLGE